MADTLNMEVATNRNPDMHYDSNYRRVKRAIEGLRSCRSIADFDAMWLRCDTLRNNLKAKYLDRQHAESSDAFEQAKKLQVLALDIRDKLEQSNAPTA